MEKEMSNTIIDQFLDEILKVAIERLKEAKPWKEREKDQTVTMNKKDATKYLGISESSINNLIKTNKIPCLRPTGPGGRVYFRIEALDRWMSKLEEESLETIEDIFNGNGFDFKVK